MLASLFRASSGPRSNQHIESVTDDAHTRNLLFGPSQPLLNASVSPPSPFGSPTSRPATFDDQAGFDLEERDVRVLLAQDAHGWQEKPSLLFDSNASSDSSTTFDGLQQAVRSPLPTTWRASQNDDRHRNRSSTFSTAQSSWSKAGRELSNRDEPFLDCMFGAQGSAKASSATKMHVIPAKVRPWSASERRPKEPQGHGPRKKVPLARAHTSGQTTTPTLASLDLEDRDALLITRLFHITLDENARIASAKSSSQNSGGQEKPPKLLERKVPAFAIGIVLRLPHPSQRPKSSHSRNVVVSNHNHGPGSTASSFGSDMQSSWTFLDAIPPSLSSSVTTSEDVDRRLDLIVENWDVVLRVLSLLQSTAVEVIEGQLQSILEHLDESHRKLPKDKSMQRPNQQMVGIHDMSVISRCPSLTSVTTDAARRLVYAIRIPRVVTGLGFSAGHWIDEARTLYRTCGGRQQNFFLFNLLTAFLGNHMQWLERLAPEWYRKQFQARNLKAQELTTLASRTVVISENRGLARRLIYVLASCLPGRCGIEGLQRTDISHTLTPPHSPQGYSRSRRASRPDVRVRRFPAGGNEEALSTSASSQYSGTSTVQHSPQKRSLRRESNRFDIGGKGIRAAFDGGDRTSSVLVPQTAAIPTAHISIRDDYSPENAVVETNDSVASADLTKMLSRAASSHRRASSVSSTWGSLVSGISEIWGNRQSTPGDQGSPNAVAQETAVAHPHRRSNSSAVAIARSSSLQAMVKEVEQGRVMPRHPAFMLQRQPNTSSWSREVSDSSTAPRLEIDETDGVIDVDLNYSTSFNASHNRSLHHVEQDRRTRSTIAPNRSGSVCSIAAPSSKRGKDPDNEVINVGGYLRRHHEDFALQAVRPYLDLKEDVKRAMRMEPTPRETLDKIKKEALPSVWVSVCTTLLADTKSFSVHRLTLRRQYEVVLPKSSGSTGPLQSSPGAGTAILRQEEVASEAVMEFDTTLADAIEKLLDFDHGDNQQPTAASRSHSRNVSAGSIKHAASASISVPNMTKQPSISSAAVRLERRDLVVGALEDVVRSVNNNLNNTQRPTAGEPPYDDQMGIHKNENALREGVRRWMLDIEQTSVW